MSHSLRSRITSPSDSCPASSIYLSVKLCGEPGKPSAERPGGRLARFCGAPLESHARASRRPSSQRAEASPTRKQLSVPPIPEGSLLPARPAILPTTQHGQQGSAEGMSGFQVRPKTRSDLLFWLI
ncbi:hypothetical protein GCM10010358_68020 [Streptomyces minutiscleroticus]|uniref:Uncharacterized protein n=1 Tax=Streptomyces minutiscleroticus TaxID=68238 RepID=A0A918NY50_9ACTN|nr:hypothetical protein GCM10010358_68020 [Streptomyces minutiscleroticus]